MNTEFNSDKIIRALDHGTRQLAPETLSGLAQARQQALSRQLVRAPAFVLDSGRWTSRLLPHTTQQWLAALIIAAAVVIGGTGYWQQHQEQQISDLDVAILTDELPIEVFVD
ncbi:MAG: DUF3619 family protein [Nitrosomonadales bacterium]|nr:DUF3619 family protein [Nitrosomonadales bacterium]